jgi:hypothetical protein
LAAGSTLTAGTTLAAGSTAARATRPAAHSAATHLLHVLLKSRLLIGIDLAIAVGVELLHDLLSHLRVHHHPATGPTRAAAWPTTAAARTTTAGSTTTRATARPTWRAAHPHSAATHLLHELLHGLLLIGIDLTVAVHVEPLHDLLPHLRVHPAGTLRLGHVRG